MKYLAVGTIILNIILYFRHNIHIYQLNYYKPEVQFKWIKKNFGTIFVNLLLGIFQMFSIFNDNTTITLFIGLLIIFYNYPKPAKKKLVYTPRIQRIFLELFVILIVTITLCYLNSFNSMVIGLSVIFILIPIVLILIDYSQKPMNKYINQTFINDAKKVLEKHGKLLVIGITGSYGKTSMKYFLTDFLSSKYDVLMTPGNLNTTLGVVRTIRENLKPNHEIFVCEMGATKPNDIKEICDLVHPTHGIITSIGPQHLESFKTIETVTGTKFELADSLPEDGMLFLNYDNEYIKKRKTKQKKVTYGVENNKTDFHVTDIKGNSDGLSFKVNGIKFNTRLIGKHNILNIVGALSVANKLGIELKDLVEKVRRLEPVPHRLELKDNGSRIIIDDAYNSNPVGSKYALDAMNDFKGIKVLITPGMVELGEKENDYNFEFGEYASSICDYVFLVNEKQTEYIKKGLLSKKYLEDKIFTFKTFEEAYNQLNELDKYGKLVVLIENDLPDQY